MNFDTLAAFAIGAIHLLISPAARADTFMVDFQASGFSSVFYGLPVPQDPVAGSIVFRAATFGSSIDSIDSVSLVIDGYAFQPNDLDATAFGGGYIFGALPWGIQGVAYGTNDFYLYAVSGLQNFTYATTSAYDGWATNTVTFSFAPVPEPAVGVLFLFGIGSIGAMRRKLTVSAG